MTSRIYPLPPSLINQMAAGEVIERPASVIKELLENALDAKAQHINITIEAAGIKLIEVSDDGSGIHPEDLPLTILNHATSKIHSLDDLFSIRSLGFRGEALSSIAGVSRFSLLSRQADSSEGYLLTLDEKTQEPRILPQARTIGTTVTVSDLFFNTPVRRRFLASEKTEWLQIEQIVKRVALSRFDVAFQLKHKNSVLHLPRIINDNAEHLKHARIKKIFGSNFLAQSEFLDIERGDMRLWGWVGLPSLMRSQNDQQYFYLNGRMIRDKLIAHAIRTAYEGHLYPGRQAVFILYLEIPPEQVDVNVHPTKHEVRFREQRQIHDFIYHQLSQMLTKASISTNQSEQIATLSSCSVTDNHKNEQLSKNHIREEQPSYTVSKIPFEKHLYQPSFRPEIGRNSETRTLTIHGTGSPPILGEDSKNEQLSSENITLQWLEPPYCLLQVGKTVLLSNYILLYQSLCRQRFIAQIAAKTIITRPFLVPIRLTPSPSIFKEMLNYQSFFETHGLSINPLDERTFIIRSFPAALPYLDLQIWLKSLEKKKLSDEILIEALIEANIPPSSPMTISDSHETRALLSEFQHYFNQPNIPTDLKRTFKIMNFADWEKILKT